ncbi:Glycosyltransferase involved in cell wall bisynthesis [Nonlabens sp. Hel1_33_55]|uniref:glycosyltransferase family 4 protein n=1 Tax=Nonlabens sp. Hel1_33_55 TaxID=1336802 RepID=UPI000875E3E1|nr:glycosyltransferase family 4 protein [Nonlabens sp. Hel1_33_55]SCX94333.1 Glycosyltransferase involved in cell wall bisynthesis [Nonlabens sp. Hel1_33_55]
MKIIRLTTLLDFGGQERKYISFTEDQTMLHHKYIFAAIGRGGNAEKIIRGRGFEVRVFNLSPSIKSLSNIKYLYKWIKSEQPDIVHTAAAEANFHGIIAARLAGVPVIIGEEIGIPTHSKIAIKAFETIYRFAQAVICVSRAVKEHLVNIGEIPATKGIVLYNPVSKPRTFSKTNSDKFRIVFVGRLEHVKNVKTLIKAFAAMQHKDKCTLTIVGNGAQRSEIEALINELQLTNVVMQGFQDTPEKFVSQANLFVLPSFSEGFGIAVVEAMMQGIPCLCSQVGGIPEFITNDDNGWLFDPNNVGQLTQQMDKIQAMDKDRLEEVGLKGLAFAKANFTSKIYIKKLESIYEELFEKSRHNKK